MAGAQEVLLGNGGFDLSAITDAALRAIRRVQRETLEQIRIDPAGAFGAATIGTRAKPLLAIDLVAERNAVAELSRRLRRYGLLVLGEESLRDEKLDLANEARLVALVDMIDGTDLLERGLSNWCSAMVFYHPPQQQIAAAFVGLPGDGIYFATKDPERPRKYRYRDDPQVVPVTGPSNVQSVENSAIAFYGQKLSAFSSVASNCRFLAYLDALQHKCSTQRKEFKTRIYNLAGNPIAMRLIDGHSRIDAIFDLNGQAPHDMVPGAFIARKAGAALCDLEGNPIDLGQILQRPAAPKSRVRYILASTEELSLELRQCLTDRRRELDYLRSAAA